MTHFTWTTPWGRTDFRLAVLEKRQHAFSVAPCHEYFRDEDEEGQPLICMVRCVPTSVSQSDRTMFEVESPDGTVYGPMHAAQVDEVARALWCLMCQTRRDHR